jgi:hypothetical protein
MAELPAMAEPLEDDELAAFQEALSEVLLLPLPPAEQVRRLREDKRTAPFRGYVAQLDLRCVEMMSLQHRRWAQR